MVPDVAANGVAWPVVVYHLPNCWVSLTVEKLACDEGVEGCVAIDETIFCELCRKFEETLALCRNT